MARLNSYLVLLPHAAAGFPLTGREGVAMPGSSSPAVALHKPCATTQAHGQPPALPPRQEPAMSLPAIGLPVQGHSSMPMSAPHASTGSKSSLDAAAGTAAAGASTSGPWAAVPAASAHATPTPLLLSMHSSSRSSATSLDPHTQQLLRPADGGLLLAQEQIVMGVQLACGNNTGGSSSSSDACSMSAFHHACLHSTSSSGSGSIACVRLYALPGTSMPCGAGQTSQLVGRKRPAPDAALDMPVAKYPAILPHQDSATGHTPTRATPAMPWGAAPITTTCSQAAADTHASSGSAPGSRQHTPCTMLVPAPYLRVPAAPRLLCHLSPSSLRDCCKVAPSSLHPGAQLLEEVRGYTQQLEQLQQQLRQQQKQQTHRHQQVMQQHQQMMQQHQQMMQQRQQVVQHMALAPAPRPLLTTTQDYLAAAMRLCGYSEARTLQLALHMWGRVEQPVTAQLPALAAQLCPAPLQPRLQAGDLRRAVLLALVWLAGKCEEQRVRQAKASVVWCLAPADIVGLGPSCLSTLETRLMAMLGWSPYAGLTWCCAV